MLTVLLTAATVLSTMPMQVMAEEGTEISASDSAVEPETAGTSESGAAAEPETAATSESDASTEAGTEAVPEKVASSESETADTSDTSDFEFKDGYYELPYDSQVPSATQDADYSPETSDGERLQASVSYIPSLSGMPGVRNQNPFGDCWAFAGISLAELNMIREHGSSTGIDLSELQLAYFTYNFNKGISDPLGGTEGDTSECASSEGFLNAGGNLSFAAQTLLNWSGAENESDDRYPSSWTSGSTLDSSHQYGKDAVHVQDVYVLQLSTDAELAKTYISEYGGLATAMYVNRSYFQSGTNAYYCPTRYSTNHAISIVGWDDNFSKSNFKNTPDGDGAWLVRNQWGGSGYGYYGYFWLSYYDKNLTDAAYVFRAEPADNYDNNYQYDGNILFSGTMGFGSSSLDAASVFQVHANPNGCEQLRAVSFEVPSATNLDYTVRIYTGLTSGNNPKSGTLAETVTGKTVSAGAYTVPVDSITLNENEIFSVVVSLSKSSGTVSIGTERNYSDENIKCVASAKQGRSFIGNGYGYWLDIGQNSGINVRVKAFTKNVASVPLNGISLNKSALQLQAGDTASLSVSYDPSDTTDDKTVSWRSDNTSVAKVSDNGTVTAVAAGTVTVTASTSDGLHSAACTVTVTEQAEDKLPFTDVNKTDWFYGSVQYVYSNGLMAGTSATTFKPYDTLTRGMFAAILYRVAGKPSVTYTSRFSDVPAGKYYSLPVTWASNTGLISGYGDTGRFGPANNITRGQIAKILYLYAKSKGYDLTATADLSGFSDKDLLKGNFVTYMQWAVTKGLISGTTSGSARYLRPGDSATRAQCAKMIRYFCENCAK
jgi:C1A family cysteine protease